MTRHEANMEILRIMVAATVKWPHQRFGQLLRNLEAISQGDMDANHSPTWNNEFYAEPQKVLERMMKNDMVIELLKEVDSV